MPSLGIIGAGLSGLVTAKTFLGAGFEVAVFEKEDEVGGVWARSRRYPGLTTQNPRDTYAFSDFPMPCHYPEWPTGEQVQAYLAAYADHFGITPHIRLKTQVEEVRRREGGGFSVRVRPAGDPAAPGEVRDFDFVIICSGLYCTPYVPELPGRDAFEAAGGAVLHSTGLHDTSRVAGKRVVVVGFAKSACDAAVASVGHAKEVTLVYRRPLWKVPRFVFGMNMRNVLTTRFAELFCPYPWAKGAERALHTLGQPLVKFYWQGVEWALDRTLRIKDAGLWPEKPILQSMGCSLSMATDGLYDHFREGRIRARRGEIARFVAGGVELASGERVDADVVIFGTGFRQVVPFLEEPIRSRILDEEGTIHLYHNLIHPDVPGLGFCGFTSSLYCQLTSEIGARWLAEHFRGRLRLPPREEAMAEVERRLDFRRRERPEGFSSGTCVTPFNFHYIDELLREMGARTRRLPWNPLREFMMPVDPSLYADLEEELDRRAGARA
jgi:cation diffusion facilitator CzcD-associated flavoprotein CzcO